MASGDDEELHRAPSSTTLSATRTPRTSPPVDYGSPRTSPEISLSPFGDEESISIKVEEISATTASHQHFPARHYSERPGFGQDFSSASRCPKKMGALEVSSDHHRINCYSHDKASDAEESSSDDDECDEVSMCVNLSV